MAPALRASAPSSASARVDASPSSGSVEARPVGAAAGARTRYIGAWHIGGSRAGRPRAPASRVELAAQQGGDLAHADRAHHRQAGSSSRASSASTSSILLRSTISSKRSVAALVEPVARRQQDQRPQRDVVADPAARAAPASRRASGRSTDHFERARDARRVAGAEPRRGVRVDCVSAARFSATVGGAHRRRGSPDRSAGTGAIPSSRVRR